MFTAPFSISQKDFDFLREEIAQLIQKIYKKAEDSKAEEIACVNLDLFWVKK